MTKDILLDRQSDVSVSVASPAPSDSPKNFLREFLFKVVYFFIKLMVIMSPVRLRIGLLHHSRIGHFLANTEFWLRKRSWEKNVKKEWNVFFVGKPVCNRQALVMFQRRIRIIENNFIFKLLSAVQRRYPEDFWVDIDHSGFNAWSIWNQSKPQLEFNANELEQGQKLLDKIGIGKNDSFICFCVRDKAYLNQTQEIYLQGGWSYQDYRDGSLENYSLLLNSFAQKGYWMLRMGAVTERELLAHHKRIVDYSRNYRTEFADMYLMAHCKFFIGDTAGIVMMSAIFNVPYVQTNVVPIGHTARSQRALFIPKKYWSVKEERFLKFKEVFDMKLDMLLKSQYYDQVGIKLIENDSAEILAVAEEMDARLNGGWKENDEDEELQQRFKSIFPSGHSFAGFPSRVGADFLRKNRELID